MKVQVTIPDGIFAEAAMTEAAIEQRTVANLCVYTLRIHLNKHQYKLPQYDELKRGRAQGRPSAAKLLQTPANGSEEELNNRE